MSLLIVWVVTPDITLLGAIQSTFGNDATVAAAIESSASILLTGAGMFLILLCLHLKRIKAAAA